MTEEEPTLYEKTLKKDEQSLSDYLQGIGEIQWKGKWKITGHQILEYDPTKQSYLTCQNPECNHWPIRELFYITNIKTGEKLIIGNKCIQAIKNIKISKRFKKYKNKIENIKNNKENFDTIETLMFFYNKDRPKGLRVTAREYSRLYMMYFRLKEGKNLTPTQKQELADIRHPQQTKIFSNYERVNGKTVKIHGKWRLSKDGEWTLMKEL